MQVAAFQSIYGMGIVLGGMFVKTSLQKLACRPRCGHPIWRPTPTDALRHAPTQRSISVATVSEADHLHTAGHPPPLTHTHSHHHHATSLRRSPLRARPLQGAMGHTTMSNASTALGYLVRAQWETLMGQYVTPLPPPSLHPCLVWTADPARRGWTECLAPAAAAALRARGHATAWWLL